MSFNAKEAAQKLFDLADVIEKQAAQKTFFVCASCNHTANLESINSTRSKFASENSIEVVSSISIEDTISCKACGGDMKYASTEESEKFFVEAADDDDDGVEDSDEDLDIVEDPDSDAEDVTEDVEDQEDEAEAEEGEAEEDEAEEDEAEEDEAEEVEEKPKKRTTKDKKDSDGKVEMKEAPEAQFGDKDKKSKTAFDKAVNRYSSF